jgi:hypothetical protein
MKSFSLRQALQTLRQSGISVIPNTCRRLTSAVRQQCNVNINAAPINRGSAARRLNLLYSANTNLTEIKALPPFRGSVYSGLQAQLTRTSERHGSTGIIYTFSKAMDASDNSQANGLTFAYPDYWAGHWAVAGYDRKHNANGGLL